jgi:hypothetical protein
VSCCCRSVCGLHGLVQLEVGCDTLGLTDLACLNPLSNLKHLALRGLGMEAGGYYRQSVSVLRRMWECWLGAWGWRQVGAAGRVVLF